MPLHKRVWMARQLDEIWRQYANPQGFAPGAFEESVLADSTHSSPAPAVTHSRAPSTLEITLPSSDAVVAAPPLSHIPPSDSSALSSINRSDERWSGDRYGANQETTSRFLQSREESRLSQTIRSRFAAGNSQGGGDCELTTVSGSGGREEEERESEMESFLAKRHAEGEKEEEGGESEDGEDNHDLDKISLLQRMSQER